MGCVPCLCKYGGRLLLAQKIGCGGVFPLRLFASQLPSSAVPLAGGRIALLRSSCVISSGGSLPTPPAFFLPFGRNASAPPLGELLNECEAEGVRYEIWKRCKNTHDTLSATR